jgi:hypothetical protein
MHRAPSGDPPEFKRFRLPWKGPSVHAAPGICAAISFVVECTFLRVRLSPAPDGRFPAMHETWLRPNCRAILFGCVPLVVLVGLGAWLAFRLPSIAAGWRWLGGAAMAVGILGLLALLNQLRGARIGYEDGRVLFHLTRGEPIGVPVEIVEAFFLGQGPAALPGGVGKNQETVNLVARLSQRETDWAKREVKPALGQWCGGYVTIRGTWCEPLTNEVIRRLNRRLKEVQTECEST